MDMVWVESSKVHSRAVKYCTPHKRPSQNSAMLSYLVNKLFSLLQVRLYCNMILHLFIIARLKESESKLQLQVQELTRRENVLNMRLATKQEEMRNLLVSVCMLGQIMCVSIHHFLNSFSILFLHLFHCIVTTSRFEAGANT